MAKLGAAGSLVVELAAATATFQQDLGKASAMAAASATKIENAFNNAFSRLKGAAFGLAATFGLTFSIQGFVGLIKGAIDAQEQLELLGKRAGISGEEMSSLQLAALTSKTSLQEVAMMTMRLNKALLDGQKEGTRASKVLGVMGIVGKKAMQDMLEGGSANAMLKFAKRLATLPEQMRSTITQMLGLGRGGRGAAFFEDLGKQPELVPTTTQAAIDRAKAFNDRMSELSLRATTAKAALADALIPTMTDVIQAFERATGGAGGLKTAIQELDEKGNLKRLAEDISTTVIVVAESLLFLVDTARVFASAVNLILADINVLAKGMDKVRETLPGGPLAAIKIPLKVVADVRGVKTASEIAFDEAMKDRKRAYDYDQKLNAETSNKDYSAWSTNFRKKIDERNRNENLWRPVVADPTAYADQVSRATPALTAAYKAQQAADAKKKQAELAAINAKKIGSGGDAFGAELQKEIKTIESVMHRELALLDERKHYLVSAYHESEISTKDYYAGLRSDAQANYNVQEKAINDEMALIGAYIAKRKSLSKGGSIGKSTQHEPDLSGDLGDYRDDNGGYEDGGYDDGSNFDAPAHSNRGGKGAVRDDRDVLHQQQRLIDLNAKGQENERKLRISIHDITRSETEEMKQQERLRKGLIADLLEIKGATSEATVIRFDVQNEDFLKKTIANKDWKTLEDLAAKRNSVALSSNLEEKKRLFDDAMGDLATEQAMISTTSITEVEALSRASEANRAKLGILREIIAAYAAIAAGATDASPKEVEAAQRVIASAKVSIAQLSNETDLVGRRVEGIFVDSFASAFSDVVTGTKSVSQAFKDMERSIVKSITDIAAKGIADTLFKGLFSSSSGSNAFGDLLMKGLGMFLGGGSGSSLPSSSASFLPGGLPGYAEGTPYVPRTGLALVHQGEAVVPRKYNTGGSRNTSLHIVINVPPTTSTSVAEQVAASVGISVRRALRRNA